MTSRASTHKTIRVFQTARDTWDRLTEKEPITVQEDTSSWNGFLNIYPDVKYQTIEGFGGAFTEAAAITLAKMAPHFRVEVLTAYFDANRGLGYTLCRTHINSCDFSLENYSYVEDGDDSLSTFDIKRDRAHLIPLIQDAKSVAGETFRLFASPWSPPGWMKTTGTMNHGGTLLPEYRRTWAQYIAKYLQTYREAGIDIWGVTVQNEPAAVQTWDSCNYTAQEEADFVRDHLGPVLDAEGFGDVNIIIWDHNKDSLYRRAKVAYEDPEASKYIWGAGFHWYSGDHFGDLDAVHHVFPDKKLLFTEGCVEGGVKLGDWALGERYGHHIIGDLNHWANGWVDWNIVLDEQGGPNHAQNYCDAPIIADVANQRLHYQPSYYYIGHVAKFVRPGAVRIGCSVYTDQLECVAFENPDGSIVVVVMNRTDSTIPYRFTTEPGKVAVGTSLAHSIQTLVIDSSN
ncbi:glycoside hydrolase family 30 protein [Alicyclobacillus kakegawensis]|uniref:glycoside hydrolase family 30 protein n=1 Tax=Alicyclobacillus kakegawensis TaxID=392012 RepID=UPI0008330773|nr:glycoside hydrolase family 30 protein [Alicyclobacillus kakegawensis]